MGITDFILEIITTFFIVLVILALLAILGKTVRDFRDNNF